MKSIHLWGVRQNNLKNIEVNVPLGKMTVICGPSGSGKSSLAFETLFAEGQRRFIESMSNYARQFLNKAPKPLIDGIENIPPAIAIEQKNTIKSSRSTVGTATEVIDYLRLLYEKAGVAHCPRHHLPVHKQSVTDATQILLKNFSGKRGYLFVEVGADTRVLSGKKLHSLLLQEGYLRICMPSKAKVKDNVILETLGEIHEISEPAYIKKGLPAGSFYLVIDRLSVNESEEGRIGDSVHQAYEASVKLNTGIKSRRAFFISTTGERLNFNEEACCPLCDYTAPNLSAKIFNFNSPIGACPKCKGFGNILELDEKKVVPNPLLSLAQGALHPFTMPSASYERKKLLEYCKKKRINTTTPWKDLPSETREILWNGNKDFFGLKGLFEYLDQIKYKMHVRVFIARYRTPFTCPDCGGSRIRSDLESILIQKKSFKTLSEMTVAQLQSFLDKIELSPSQTVVAQEILKQLRSRLDFLMRVGVHYLSINRETRTLSGGEYQRLILANQLGMGLSQSLYVLDEPTVGLHPRDNDRLISILHDLKNLGNTVVIVEHDKDVIKNAENIIEMGPGSGSFGGTVTFSGDYHKFVRSKESITAPFLQKAIDTRTSHRPVDMKTYRYKLNLEGASGHNLKDISVSIPLHRLVTVTGVSGSGKSTLITKTLYPAIARKLEIEFLPSQPFKSLDGCEHLKNVILIDQSSIGKSARSSPITYLKAYDAIRSLMAATPEAKSRGYTAGTFSLNVDGGRCPSCKGTGHEEIDMMFMDDVVIPCDVCDGKKFRPEVLDVLLYGKNIHQILSMTVNEAMGFFVAHPNIRKPLSILKEVGLDYIAIGQSASSLSGGESQRLKIARELTQVQQKDTLYILDEPTTGLHFKEIELLLKVLHQLIDMGGSVLVVEHNLDVIAASDYVIDLGPDAGEKGGDIVAQGPPLDLIKSKRSLTGQYLKKYLEGN